MMTHQYFDANGQSLDGTPTNTPDGDFYQDFVHVPSAAEIADHDGRMAHNSAMLNAIAKMPPDVEEMSRISVALLIDGNPAEGKRLGRIVQSWRAMALADAQAAIERGDHGAAAMHYAIARAARDG